jgi:hypothetical protein
MNQQWFWTLLKWTLTIISIMTYFQTHPYNWEKRTFNAGCLSTFWFVWSITPASLLLDGYIPLWGAWLWLQPQKQERSIGVVISCWNGKKMATNQLFSDVSRIPLWKWRVTKVPWCPLKQCQKTCYMALQISVYKIYKQSKKKNLCIATPIFFRKVCFPRMWTRADDISLIYPGETHEISTFRGIPKSQKHDFCGRDRVNFLENLGEKPRFTGEFLGDYNDQ